MAIDDIESICLNYIEQNKNMDGTEVAISFNQFHIGPDMLRCLRQTGYMPPQHTSEYVAQINDLLN